MTEQSAPEIKLVTIALRLARLTLCIEGVTSRRNWFKMVVAFTVFSAMLCVVTDQIIKCCGSSFRFKLIICFYYLFRGDWSGNDCLIEEIKRYSQWA